MPFYVPLPTLPEKTVEAFWAKLVKAPDGCWIWPGSRDKNGYGKVKLRGGTYRCHRVAYQLHYEDNPGSKLVCHTCDNQSCCNPAHLFLGTHADNMSDMVTKGRQRGGGLPGEQSQAAKLTEAQVEQIRDMIRAGASNVGIASIFGVTHSAISRIRRGRAWGQEPMMEPYKHLRKVS